MARTSTRQAAQKAKEAISINSETGGKAAAGSKRKATEPKASQPKKEKKEEQGELETEVAQDAGVDGVLETKPAEEEQKSHRLLRQLLYLSEHRSLSPAAAPTAAPPVSIPAEPSIKHSPTPEEGGVLKSKERETLVSSTILEKGIIYFFFRPRVNVEEPQGVSDVARSFFVLRPTPLGAELDGRQGPLDKDAQCRLLMLPKKKFPVSPKERDMGFVEKSRLSMKELHDSFIASSTYQTATRGERTIEEARPYAEGVYAITSTQRSSHLAYVLTIPEEPGPIQEDFGLHSRGSWIVQSKNPKFPGPSFAQLPKEPQYPEQVLQKFGDLRWVPLEPEFIEYPNAQFLMIGEAHDHLGKAATAEDRKQPYEEEPGQELEKLQQENEQRIDALQGDLTIYKDLGLWAKQYSAVPTTWNS
ncbi:hypothetical protein N7462_001918 [Penicillium macrosclerotiorum]|uniref:uncharacterized protein n=1 Tax=Penicillium macrosclerotiorum TaxID=303699 RepID=UPI00254776B1|nr:uncharacterized protein N7462_001918 [Penicillium macrosclerotiorum]KAJ5692495.1 hypothetical protein N7462_001918 [Penicillium macrosclerotiorum]